MSGNPPFLQGSQFVSEPPKTICADTQKAALFLIGEVPKLMPQNTNVYQRQYAIWRARSEKKWIFLPRETPIATSTLQNIPNISCKRYLITNTNNHLMLSKLTKFQRAPLLYQYLLLGKSILRPAALRGLTAHRSRYLTDKKQYSFKRKVLKRKYRMKSTLMSSNDRELFSSRKEKNQ